MTKTQTDLSLLKEKDLINLMLFGLYKLKDDPMYASLCNLIFVLDKDSFYKLCATYGGATIKIPTLQEMELLTNTLCVYQAMYTDKLTFEHAMKKLPETISKADVAKTLKKLKDIIDNYEQSK